ncbi:hypothetical protein MBLNU457_2067t1 [Dothideomycetes sp. NU457]
MSTRAKMTLAGTTLGALGIIVFVHYTQKAEKAAMHQGVVRDMEQQRLKRERQADFEMQAKLEEEYRKVQNVTPDPYAAQTGRKVTYEITSSRDVPPHVHGEKSTESEDAAITALEGK